MTHAQRIIAQLEDAVDAGIMSEAEFDERAAELEGDTECDEQ